MESLKQFQKNFEPDFYPDINDYLRFTINSASPARSNVNEMIAFVRARTALSKTQCKILISSFFKEIIDLTSSDEYLKLDKLGAFYRGKERARLLFRPSKELKRNVRRKAKKST